MGHLFFAISFGWMLLKKRNTETAATLLGKTPEEVFPQSSGHE
ncbi:MAG: hypothetical protein QNL68_05250 [Akkermansiaceae bacterium]